MIIEFILSIVFILASVFLSSLTSGGRLSEIWDILTLIEILAIFLVSINFKKLKIIFYSKKKFQNVSLSELQAADGVLENAIETLKILCLFFPLIGLIHFFANYNDWPNKTSAGPDLAVIILPFIYYFIFDTFILTLKQKIHNTAILYMAEEPINEKINIMFPNKKQQEHFQRNVASFTLLAVGVFIILKTTELTPMGNAPFSFFLDLPSLIIVLLVFPLLAMAGSFKSFFKSIKFCIYNKKMSITEKLLYKGNMDFLRKIFMNMGICSTLIGWVGMMNNLEDESTLAPNLAVSLISIFYAVLLNLLLYPFERKIDELSEIKE